jgi:hypothetical protein
MQCNIRYLSFTILTFSIGISIVGLCGRNATSQSSSFDFVKPSEKQITIAADNLPVKTPRSIINFESLKINGIGLSSTKENLIREFGKPKKIINHGDFYNCGDEDTKTFFFDGLEVELTHNSERKSYEISGIDLSSRNLETESGVKLGDSFEKIREEFGNPYHHTTERNIDSYHFGVSKSMDISDDGGNVTFAFQHNKLIKISWSYNFC